MFVKYGWIQSSTNVASTLNLSLDTCAMKYERDGGCPNYGRIRIVNGILDIDDLSECNQACLKK